MAEVTIYFQKEYRSLLNPFITQFPNSSEIQYSKELVGGSELMDFIATITPAMVGALAGVIIALLKSRKLRFKYKNPCTNVEFELELTNFKKKESLDTIDKLIQNSNDPICNALLTELTHEINNDFNSTEDV